MGNSAWLVRALDQGICMLGFSPGALSICFRNTLGATRGLASSAVFDHGLFDKQSADFADASHDHLLPPSPVSGQTVACQSAQQRWSQCHTASCCNQPSWQQAHLQIGQRHPHRIPLSPYASQAAHCLLQRVALATDQNSPGGCLDEKIDGSEWGPGSQQLSKSLQRLLLEAYNLLQQGKVEPAEQLVAEGIGATEVMAKSEPLGLAQLRDQLALLKFVRGDLPRAETCARDSLAWAQDNFSDQAPITAVCQLRLGSVLVAARKYEDALPLLKASKATLHHSMGQEYAAAAEAAFYTALVHVANPLLEAERDELYRELEQGLVGMRKQEGAGDALVSTALREHHRLTEAAVAAEDWAQAKALFDQEVRLHEAVRPGSPGVAQAMYHHCTFLYVLDDLPEARVVCQRSIDLCNQLYKPDDEHVLLRMHRMGTICLAEADFDRAVLLLHDAEKYFQEALGPRHPLTGEAQLCLSIARIKLIDSGQGITDPFSRILAPSRRLELLRHVDAGLMAMQNGYGHDHMLVEKAASLREKFLATAS